MSVAQQVQTSFGSWDEMGENFLDGREIWSGKRDPKFDSSYRLLGNAKDPNSPWNQSPWNCDLSQPSNPKTTSAP
jgi:hypothetical protein